MRPISREHEAKLPKFSSHIEAREYFKSEYGEDFVMNGVDEIHGKEIFFYHLITVFLYSIQKPDIGQI